MEIDVLSAYKILACNRHIYHLSQNPVRFNEQLSQLRKKFAELHRSHKDKGPLDINAVLEMQMAFTECDFLPHLEDENAWRGSASSADLFAATRDWVLTMFHIFNNDVDMRKGTNCISHRIADGYVLLTKIIMMTLQALGYDRAQPYKASGDKMIELLVDEVFKRFDR